MKVNIDGKGMISFLGIMAPVRNYDVSELQLKALVCIKTLKVYDSMTNVRITPVNVANVINNNKPSVVVVEESESSNIVTPLPKISTEIKDVVEESVEEIQDVVEEDIVEEQPQLKEETDETVVEETGETVVEETVKHISKKKRNKKN